MGSRSEPRGRRTAAWSLAAPAIVVLALGSALVMAAGYWMLAGSIRARGDAWLEAEVESIAEGIHLAGSSLTAAELEVEVREIELHEGLSRSGGADGEGFFFLAVLAPGGRVAASAVRGARGELSEVLAATGRPESAANWVLPEGWERPVRIVGRQLPGGPLVLAGATPHADAELLEELRDLAVAGWVVMLLVGVPVAALQVRRVLGRVDRLTEVATTISAESLSRRLPQRQGPGDGDEIDRLAATFNGLLDRAGGAVEQLRSVADALAHDLGTPLAAMRGNLEGALRSGEPGRQRAALERAIGEIDDLAALIAATLDTVEAEAGAMRLTRGRLDLAELVSDLAELYEPAATERGLELIVEARGPVAVHGDEALLRRLVVNLLENALAHLPAATRVTLTVVAQEERAVLTVADDGPGFAPEVGERAFDRLVRGHGSRGRGLGLAIVRAVALAHGGRAVLEQPAAGGSVVRIELPT